MNNDYLIKLIRESEWSRPYRSERFEDVLSAMKNVDRRKFLPSNLYVKHSVLTPIFETIQESALGAIKSDDKEAIFKASVLIMSLIRDGVVADDYVVDINGLAYNDEVLGIGKGQTCSQPSVVALMADLLELKLGLRVLEIGTGCGYSAAVSKTMIGNSGVLVSVEYIPELAFLGMKNLGRHFRRKLDVVPMNEAKGIADSIDGIVLLQGDGSEGFPAFAPYDRIYFTAGVSQTFNPKILAAQLASDYGVILYPEKDGSMLKEVYRGNECISKEAIAKLRFVPLVGSNS